MYETVNLEDTIDVTLSNVTDHNTSPVLPTFHIIVLRSKEGKAMKTKLLPLVDRIRCFALLFVIKITGENKAIIRRYAKIRVFVGRTYFQF